MEYIFNRLDPRVLPKKGDRINVIDGIVIGMTGADENGVSAYRDTLVKLREPDDSFIAFEDITPEWVGEICKKTAEDNGWEESIAAEVEAKKTAPVSMQFEWQKPKPAPAPEPAPAPVE
jgi:hypothetical protein